ncbi:MAG: extracellular solute-binding protein [Reyranellaceae bacterium]
MKTSPPRPTRRKLLRAAGAGSLLVPFSLAAGKAPAQGGKKPFEGVTLNISCWSATYPTLLAQYIPEFTEKTGIKVNYDTPGFPVYNQRADLELSTKGSGFDVLNVTFIFTSRWIGAGWLSPLDEFLKNPERTPADWDFADFVPGAVDPMRDKKGGIYGVPWISDALMAGAGRFDLFKANGLAMPDTFDDLDKAMQAVNKKDNVAAYGIENHWGWTFIPFLQGFGGNVFRNPPDDLMPTLDTPEAVAAVEFFARLINSYGPPAAAGYTYDQITEAMRAGRINYAPHNHAFLALLGEAGSKVTATSNFAMVPKGPKGRFPGVASHGWGIPVGAKNKAASWEFIKWALSKEMVQRLVEKHGLGSVTRQSVMGSPAYKDKMVINGVDTGKIFLDTIAMASQGGYMKYRTVHVYPQANAQINQAVSRVVSGQMKAKESMALAQTNALADLKRAGVKL